jgi:hypothetical protein
MKYKVETHPGVVIENPEIEILKTIDYPKNKTFQPIILFIFGESRIYHELPEYDYINDTWGDDDVDNTITEYLKTIEISE